jgi:hypothetical protein
MGSRPSLQASQNHMNDDMGGQRGSGEDSATTRKNNKFGSEVLRELPRF